MSNYQIWKTKDGREIPLKQMTISHLKATLALLYKTKERFMFPARIFATNELADEIMAIAENNAATTSSWIEAIENEIKERNNA